MVYVNIVGKKMMLKAFKEPAFDMKVETNISNASSESNTHIKAILLIVVSMIANTKSLKSKYSFLGTRYLLPILSVCI